MRIAMIGVGYVGLVSGACFAEFGTRVVCVDRDAAKIEQLNAGGVPIYEPGLEALVARNVEAGRLRFTTEMGTGCAGADAVFIAVGTPTRDGDGHADLSYVFAAAREIARHCEPETVVVTKSTVPVGTGREIARVLAEEAPSKRVHVAANPEFLREGTAIHEFMRPDRVIVGAETDQARQVLAALYRPLYLNETPMVTTDVESAELTKYAANAFLAMKVSFINEMADLAEAVGADVHDIAKGIGLDGRIGRKFLHPGPGYGGSCFPKDTRALAASAREVGRISRLVEAAVAVNEARKSAMAEKILGALEGDPAGQTVAVLGLTFKQNTDDMREAPSLDIVPYLQAKGVTVRAHDPEGMPQARKRLADIVWCADPYEAMTGADAVVILTEWNQFRNLDLEAMKTRLRAPVMVDLRNVYEPESMAAAGFRYVCVGRPVPGATGRRDSSS